MVISPFTQKAEQIIGREGETATFLISQKRPFMRLVKKCLSRQKC